MGLVRLVNVHFTLVRLGRGVGRLGRGGVTQGHSMAETLVSVL